MNRSLLAALALASITVVAGPARAGDDPWPCQSLAETSLIIGTWAQEKHFEFLTLNDARARAFLKDIGAGATKLNIDAAHVLILYRADRPNAVVTFADGACGGFYSSFQPARQIALDAYQRATR